MSTVEKRTKVMHVRLTELTHARLRAWAGRERRSLTLAVELLVERGLDAEDAKDRK